MFAWYISKLEVSFLFLNIGKLKYTFFFKLKEIYIGGLLFAFDLNNYIFLLAYKILRIILNPLMFIARRTHQLKMNTIIKPFPLME